ncbi:MAG: antibiotic biosynthesis monooxygenase [Chloroflexota bacterium]|nr:antibiotic biosynthesis monooxygenase [Chloroflexota bacterium]
MALISVTRLRLRSVRYLLPFYWHSLKSARQARRAPGFLGGQLAGERGKAYWTVTAWRDESAMRAYRNTDSHLKAMPKLLNWCDEASVVHWQQDGPELPDMNEALRRMVAEGRVSKVNHPSPAHAAKQIPARQAPRPGFRLRPA